MGAASVLHHLDTILLLRRRRRLGTTWKFGEAAYILRYDSSRSGRRRHKIVAATAFGIVAVLRHHDPLFRRRRRSRTTGADNAALAAGRGGDRVRPQRSLRHRLLWHDDRALSHQEQQQQTRSETSQHPAEGPRPGRPHHPLRRRLGGRCGFIFVRHRKVVIQHHCFFCTRLHRNKISTGRKREGSKKNG